MTMRIAMILLALAMLISCHESGVWEDDPHTGVASLRWRSQKM